MHQSIKSIPTFSQKQYSPQTKQITEQYVLEKYLQCIPGRDSTKVTETIQKSQQQFLSQYHYQIEQSNTQNNSSQIQDELQQNMSEFTFNTPQLTKIVIDKIINSLTAPINNQDISLHIMHMKNIAQDQEKDIQRALIEGEKSKFNRKVCQFDSFVREDPKEYCADYYKKQYNLQQKYINSDKQLLNKCNKVEQHYFNNNADTDTRNQFHQTQYTHLQTKNTLQISSKNVLQSRCSNISSTATNAYLHQKTSSMNISNYDTNNSSNQFLKQNIYQQPEVDSTQQGQFYSQNLVQQQNIKYENQQQSNIKQENVQQKFINYQNIQKQNEQAEKTIEIVSSKKKKLSSHKKNKENNMSPYTDGNEITGRQMGIINHKIRKENKKRTETILGQNSSQDQQPFVNNTISTIPPTNILTQINSQQQNNSSSNYINQVPAIQQTSITHKYPTQPPQQFYNNSLRSKTMYSPIYQQQQYLNQKQIPIGAVNNQLVYKNPDCNNYYMSNQQKLRHTDNSSQQNFENTTNFNNRVNNQVLDAKQQISIQENIVIDSQNQAPCNVFNQNYIQNSHLDESNVEDFYKNQYLSQQTYHQSHIQQQNSLLQLNMDDDIQIIQVDDVFNNYVDV